MPHAAHDLAFDTERSSNSQEDVLQHQTTDSTIPSLLTANIRPSPAASSLELGPWRSELIYVLRRYIRRLERYREHHIKYDDLAHFGIIREPEPINLSTGGMAEPRYFKQIPFHTLHQWLGETKGYEERDDFIHRYPGQLHDPTLTATRQWRATYFWNLISVHLSCCGQSAAVEEPIIGNKVQWDYYGHDSKTLHRLAKDGSEINTLIGLPQTGPDYAVKNVYRCYTVPSAGAPTRPIDENVPHCSAFVADTAPLRRDELSTSELMAIMWLGVMNATDTLLRKHKAFPVLLVAGSGTQIRVHQACFYPKDKVYTIQSSPIMDFPNGVREKMDEYYTLLGWVIAEPVGDTRR